jgi:hypothetical protein
MKKFRLYYWGEGLEQWIEIFSIADVLDELIERFQNEKRKHPHLNFKATEENQIHSR